MKINENDTKYVKNFYGKLCDLCDILDEKEIWNTPDYPAFSLREVFRHDLAEFMMYLSSSDGYITEEEAAFFTAVTGYNGDLGKLAAYVENNGIYSAKFESETPLIIRIVSECERNMGKNSIFCNVNKSLSELFSEFFSMVGKVLISVDKEVACPETEDLNIYRITIDSYINRNSPKMEDSYNLIDMLRFETA